MSILLATGVDYEIMTVTGPITEDEIMGFATALDEEGWFSELAAS